MSNDNNTNIRERAFEAMDSAEGSNWGRQLEQAMKHDDLDRMRELTQLIEQYNEVWEAESA